MKQCSQIIKIKMVFKLFQRRPPNKPTALTPQHPRLEQALSLIRAQARPDELPGMARFGLVGAGRLGLSVPAMRRIAAELGHEHTLALALWQAQFPEACMVASMVAEPALFTADQMDQWVDGFVAWDICDQVCQNAFCRTVLAWDRLPHWVERKDEFGRRAAFALIAMLSVHAKAASNDLFMAVLPYMESAAKDDRNYVKKGVNWALRSVGKRNPVLHQAAIATALRIQAQKSRSAKWIASDALRELHSAPVLARMHSMQPRP